MNREKVKYDIKRVLVVSNLLFLLRMPVEFFEGTNIHQVITLYLETAPLANLIILCSFAIYNYLLGGGVRFSEEGLFVEKSLIKWGELIVDLKAMKPRFFILNRKIKVRSKNSAPINLQINYFNERSFKALADQYVSKENDLIKALNIFSRKD